MALPTNTRKARLGRYLSSYAIEGAVVLAVVLTAGVPLAVPATRRLVAGWMRCGRTRRLMRAGLAATKMLNASGQLPRIWRVAATPVGERVSLRTRPGHSAELLQVRMEELRAACKAITVRIERDPRASNRIQVDVVRKDPLAATSRVAWLDQDQPTLTLWDPVHLGLSEFGQAVRARLVYRGVLVGGLMDSGKSSLLSLAVSHAAKTPGQLHLIDPQGVQFGPWRDRATTYAQQDPAEALAVLEAVQAEIDARLAFLEQLPGVVRKVPRELADEHGLHPFVLGIDELAFHTATVGTKQQQDRFSATARDVVARGRAVGLIPLVATQRPTQDVVPRALSDLFGMRAAFRVANGSNSDVILGEAMAARGFNASEIDDQAPGVCWLLAGGLVPDKVKVAWVSDDTIADLSLTTVPLKPRPWQTAAAA